MDGPRPCGCKGCRTCLVCEKEFNLQEKPYVKYYKTLKEHVFCYKCNKIYPGDDVTTVISAHPQHDNHIGIEFPGIFILSDFILPNEEEELMTYIDSIPWDGSQSGRRKQQYGPKTNFKKMKLSHGPFKGYPAFSRFLQDRYQQVPLLEGYKAVEQCSLEYCPDKGASIDPHIDDCWIWGERIVTVNCCSDTILTLVKYTGDPKRFNLPVVDTYASQLISPLFTEDQLNKFNEILIKVPMPKGSLFVMYGPPRYQFEHSILREDIVSRRVCVTYREFTPMYLENGQHSEKGEPILETAKTFWPFEISTN